MANGIASEEMVIALGKAGFLQRTDQQFHWFNDDFENFDDFLNQLASRKRKTIRKERREALANGIEIEILRGNDAVIARRAETDDAVVTTWVSAAELSYGAAKSRAPETG